MREIEKIITTLKVKRNCLAIVHLFDVSDHRYHRLLYIFHLADELDPIHQIEYYFDRKCFKSNIIHTVASYHKHIQIELNFFLRVQNDCISLVSQ